jgi:hypothetical protein
MHLVRHGASFSAPYAVYRGCSTTSGSAKPTTHGRQEGRP